MIPWILAFLILILQILPKEKPSNPSFGILKYGDPYFQSWSDSLVKVTILENNWLTSSKAKCASVLDHIFGHCLHINNMENDAQTLSDLASLSPFHMFCYTVIRRCLEIISLYLVRWLPLGSLFGLLSSSCALIWIYFSNRWKPMKEKAAAKSVSENQIHEVVRLHHFQHEIRSLKLVIIHPVADFVNMRPQAQN
ncbi:hypothetical protein AVEN_190157-1 [Araneus ventricosus]|uniref:Uncharacterized protein n=1 Tax=Araneus ventricosus TaxID=182803 RepID=A0A4Y2SN22_ARAVE|nr:hypothetical protein AVEN_190157-1 [Araneus ventricosus]